MVFNPLYIVWNFNPVLFSVGGLDIRYYGLMWALAILVGAKFFDNFCKREGLPSSVSESIFIYGTLATIIGSRLGHCLFYEPQHYLAHPLAIITEIRNGGTASHGAAVGLLIGLWLFSRRNKLPYIWSLDRIMIPVAIGGAAVRFGNLFNSEIVGSVTDMPWGFKFVRLYRDLPLDAVPVQHPTQLYDLTKYYLEVSGRNILYRYTIEYADAHRKALNAVRTTADLRALLDADRGLVDDFIRYAARKGVAPRYGDIARSRQLMEAQLKAYIGRNTSLEDSGYFLSIYPEDEVIVRAIGELEHSTIPTVKAAEAVAEGEPAEEQPAEEEPAEEAPHD